MHVDSGSSGAPFRRFMVPCLQGGVRAGDQMPCKHLYHSGWPVALAPFTTTCKYQLPSFTAVESNANNQARCNTTPLASNGDTVKWPEQGADNREVWGLFLWLWPPRGSKTTTTVQTLAMVTQQANPERWAGQLAM